MCTRNHSLAIHRHTVLQRLYSIQNVAHLSNANTLYRFIFGCHAWISVFFLFPRFISIEWNKSRRFSFEIEICWGFVLKGISFSLSLRYKLHLNIRCWNSEPRAMLFFACYCCMFQVFYNHIHSAIFYAPRMIPTFYFLQRIFLINRAIENVNFI